MIQIQSYPAPDLAATINELTVKDGELVCWWLGQAEAEAEWSVSEMAASRT